MLLKLDEPCQNKSCVRRGSTEEKLMAKWEKVKTELGGKVKGVQKLRRSVSGIMSGWMGGAGQG